MKIYSPVLCIQIESHKKIILIFIFISISSQFLTYLQNRPKLSLLQQIVDILKKFYSVITPPQDPGPAPTLPIHGTSDLDTSVLHDSECRADNDETAQQDCYKLICLRFAVSCSQSLRNQKFIFPMEGEGNRYYHYYRSCLYILLIVALLLFGKYLFFLISTYTLHP